MPRLDENRLEVAKSIQVKLAQENLLTPSQARSFVRCLQMTWDVEIIRWEDQDSSMQLSSAYNLIHVAGIFKDVEGVNSFNSVQCYRRAAEQLEWLTRADDKLKNEVPISLLAGAAYQLGSLPAMAKGLLKQIQSDDAGWRLFCLFLQADFDGVIETTLTFWKRSPELTEKKASSQILNGDKEDAVSWYITVELIRTIGLIAFSLRSGHQGRLEKALEKLDAIQRMAIRSLNSDMSLLITMLNEVANGFNNASIYKSINRLADLDPTKTSKLKTLARRQYHIGRGVLWPSQLAGIERLLEQSSFALCTPTGSGKTLVANLALIKELLLMDNDPLIAPLAIYLVPSRALAGEVETKLNREMGNEFIITGLYGGNDWGVTDYWLNAERPTVLIATVEKADALMRYLNPIIIPRLKLLIIDEAHQVVPNDPTYAAKNFANHSDRSIRLESFVSRILVQSPNIARMALTAVAGGAADPVARWIESRKDAHPVGLNYRSTRQVIGILETRSGSAPKLNLDFMNGAPLSVVGRDGSPYLNLRIETMPQLPATIRNSLNHYNQLEILWTAMHLRRGGRRILISLTQVPERTMKWYCEALSLEAWAEITTFQPPENIESREFFDETMATCIDYCGEDSYEVKLLKVGIATSHGQMPQRPRLLMTNLIERGICSITIATATLTEGVNLPFDIIFLPQLRRQSFDPDEERTVAVPLSISEFRNLSGRAGRPGSARSMEGLTLIALPQVPSTTANGAKNIQIRQIRDLKKDYINLRERLVAEEKVSGAINSPLALLIHTLFFKARASGLVEDEGGFLDWLDRISPSDISDNAATGHRSDTAQLADTLDELDGLLLSAIEEIHRMDMYEIDVKNIEESLKGLWAKTFSAYAAVQELWMENAFIKRGKAIIETIYPDQDERKRLYQYGFPPYLGRRFEGIFDPIKETIMTANRYGAFSIQKRCDIFEALAELISDDRGYGFSVRESEVAKEVLNNWRTVLNWWLNNPEVDSPQPDELREWQRFVSENLEFRLGVIVGAVIARSWAHGANDPLAIPSLEEWKKTTGLPWFGFWVRELLKWGTHDPFVAFALSQGIAKTRPFALSRKLEFLEWLENNYEELDEEDLIDPQLFLQWQNSLPKRKRPEPKKTIYQAELTGTDGKLGQYNVVPVHNEGIVIWLDPAGYELARSNVAEWNDHVFSHKSDFKMTIANGSVTVTKVF
ncbi:DEAD/DEAH box helicase [Nitrosomonas sp.]|uniref:DEAD/DEAH box helicase n=1 Tax=Nitrosomonas sp. TaxID=42353 RepID=UPI0025D012EA|nr:DEAD/DEAH box helicase [Nitrosomonas sp.]